MTQANVNGKYSGIFEGKYQGRMTEISMGNLKVNLPEMS
jgi:hypothetical protein